MTPTGDSDGSSSEDTVRVGTIDRGRLLLVGAGPGSAWPWPAASPSAVTE